MMLGPHMRGASPVTLRNNASSTGASERLLAGSTLAMNSSTLKCVGWVLASAMTQNIPSLTCRKAMVLVPQRRRATGRDAEMWLLDKFLQRAIKVGKLIVVDHDGKEYEYGPGPEGMEHGPMRLRLTSRKAAAHIARYPQVGAGEAY